MVLLEDVLISGLSSESPVDHTPSNCSLRDPKTATTDIRTIDDCKSVLPCHVEV